jgi:hypothetical protein
MTGRFTPSFLGALLNDIVGTVDSEEFRVHALDDGPTSLAGVAEIHELWLGDAAFASVMIFTLGW